MNFKISEYPSPDLVLELQPDEKIITEKGTLVYCEGEPLTRVKSEDSSSGGFLDGIFNFVS